MTRRRLVVYFLAALLLIGCAPRRAGAQSPVYTSPQTVQQPLATNTACTGGPQTFPVENLGQTQHYASVTTVGPGTLSMFLQGQDAAGNQIVISDVAYAGSAFAFVPAVTGSGYYPKIAVVVTCDGGNTFTLNYSGTSATSNAQAGVFLGTAVDKPIFSKSQGSTVSTAAFIPPFGSTQGKLALKYSGTAVTGSTLSVQCFAAAVPGALPITYSFPIAAITTTQIFPVSASTCQNIIVTYTSGGASANPFTTDYLFDPPGLQSTGDPCQTSATSKSSVAINVTTATTTQLVPLLSAAQVFVCGVSMTIAPSATTADTATFEYGTGASCGTGTTVLTGAFGAGDLTTAAPPLFVTFADPGTTFKLPSGNALCLLSAGTTVNIQGVLTYVQQ